VLRELRAGVALADSPGDHGRLAVKRATINSQGVIRALERSPIRPP
jgi:hypothetical protein